LPHAATCCRIQTGIAAAPPCGRAAHRSALHCFVWRPLLSCTALGTLLPGTALSSPERSPFALWGGLRRRFGLMLPLRSRRRALSSSSRVEAYRSDISQASYGVGLLTWPHARCDRPHRMWHLPPHSTSHAFTPILARCPPNTQKSPACAMRAQFGDSAHTARWPLLTVSHSLWRGVWDMEVGRMARSDV
jgi:hypothetical protein